MTKEEEQENNVLAKEIESWNSFEYSLREEEYSKASDAKGKYNSTTESLFMVLIFQQQKMISKLIDKLSNIK
jgi:hypothetical protein